MKGNKICKFCCYFQPDFKDEGECCVDTVTEPTNAYKRACKLFTSDEEENYYNDEQEQFDSLMDEEDNW